VATWSWSASRSQFGLELAEVLVGGRAGVVDGLASARDARAGGAAQVVDGAVALPLGGVEGGLHGSLDGLAQLGG
jgi:hypothetical protein